MDVCPKCENTPITFGEWNKGFSAFSCSCRACVCELKGKTTNYVLFAVTIVGTILTLVVAHYVFNFTLERRGLMFLVLVIPPLYLGSALGYFFGGYDAKYKS